jgi:hypothetical protein
MKLDMVESKEGRGRTMRKSLRRWYEPYLSGRPSVLSFFAYSIGSSYKWSATPDKRSRIAITKATHNQRAVAQEPPESPHIELLRLVLVH